MKIISLLSLPLFLGSCSLFSIKVDPVRHLLEASVPARTANSSQLAVAIARPTVPPYLERSELVTRSGTGTLEIHEKELWAEPLDQGIARVVADNLRRLTGSANVQPSGNFVTQDYATLVEIRIERFDPLPDGTLVLECTWKAQLLGGGDAAPRSFRTAVPVVESAESGINIGKRGRIVAMNEALARLSRTIVKSL